MSQVWVAGRVRRGHRVASGTGDTPYPAGTIALQAPYFVARGLDLSGLHPATLNVDLAPVRWAPLRPVHTFAQVAWSELIEPETFSFLPARLRHAGREVTGWVYRPHPETKPGHHQPDTVIELLLPLVPGLGYGDDVQVGLDTGHVRLEGLPV